MMAGDNAASVCPTQFWCSAKYQKKNVDSSPGWCGSVDGARACEPKDRRLDSQSGHMPGLQP